MNESLTLSKAVPNANRIKQPDITSTDYSLRWSSPICHGSQSLWISSQSYHYRRDTTSCRHQEKKKLRRERPDALDSKDVSDATCLTRMQIATAPYIPTQIAVAPGVQTQIAMASAYRTEYGRVFSFWTQPCQGIFLLDAAMSVHFPSGRSRVRAFSYWTRPDDACQGTTFTLAVKARNIAANTRVVFANTQWVPGIVTQSSSILYIYGMYIYICYYTLRISSKSTQRHTHRRDHHMQ